MELNICWKGDSNRWEWCKIKGRRLVIEWEEIGVCNLVVNMDGMEVRFDSSIVREMKVVSRDRVVFESEEDGLVIRGESKDEDGYYRYKRVEKEKE
jgi:hypothetical protein